MGVCAIKLPDIGEGTVEAELVEWAVKVGDEVSEDDVVAAVMTDKATIEIPSSVSGTVVWLGASVGDKVAVGSDLLRLEIRENNDAHAAAPTAGADVREFPHSREDLLPAPLGASAPREDARSRPLASPAVRRLARDMGVDLNAVKGSGPAGRILRPDIEAMLRMPDASVEATDQQATREVKIVGLRRVISERMAASVHQAAQFSYVEEVDVDKLEDLRAALNTREGDRGQRLTLLPFIVKAISAALKDFPQMNAHFESKRDVVVRYDAFHAGIATQTADGLMVPVLRDADRMPLRKMANAIARLTSAARDGNVKRDELIGSTLTITSLGALGGLVTTPVLNLPEVAIVGINKIAIRPVWTGTSFVPRRIMNLSSSFDHRVIDGQDAALFVRRIKSLLEEPATMFIAA